MNSRHRFAVAFFAVVCLLLCGDLFAGTWEAFRGPGSRGIAEHQNLPVKFDPATDLIWKTAIPGTSNSSPIVWNDQLFVFSSSADGSERMLLCLDAKTGAKTWEKTFKGHKASAIHKKNSLASSTPTTDGKAVYVAVWDGDAIAIHALDMKGQPMWEKDLGAWKSEHGAGASPMLYKDKLIFTLDMDGKSVLYVFDKDTGKIDWSAPREAHRACYSMPQILTRPDGDELIVTSTTCITSYNPDTGSRNWNWQWSWPAAKGGKKSGLRTIATSLEEKGVLVASSGEGGAGRLAVALKLPTTPGAQPTQAWENRKEFPYIPSGLVHDGHFYFANDIGLLGCWDMKTGKKVWYERTDAPGFVASPILVDGKIYAASEDGNVFVFPAATKFDLLARNTIGERIRATPAVADGRLFVRGEKTLFCFGKKDSKD